MLLGLLVAVAYLPGILSPAIAPRWAVVAAGVPALAWWLGRPARLPVTDLALLAAFLCWVVASLSWSPDGLLDAGTAVQWLALGAAVGLGSSLGSADLRRVLVGLSLGLGLGAVVAAAQHLGYPGPTSYADGNPAGLFYNRNAMAELAAPVLVWALLSREWLLAVLPVLSLIVVHDRTAVVAIAASLLLSRRGGTLFAGLALVVSLAAILALAAPDSLLSRWEIWGETIRSLTVLGHGAGSFFADFPQYEEVHDDFLQLAYEYGVGAALILALGVRAVAGPRTPERLALVAIAVESVTSWPLYLPATAFLAAVLLGHLRAAGIDVRAPLAHGRGPVRGAVRSATSGV